MIGIGLGAATVAAILARRSGGGGGPATPPTIRGYLAMTPKTFNSSTMSANAPAETEIGDLLLMFVGCDGGVTFSGLPAGWTQEGIQSNGSVVTGAVFSKIADGSDTFDATLSASEQNTGGMFALTGANTVEVGGYSTGSSNTPNSGELVLSQERAAVWFSFVALDNNLIADPPSALPTDFASYEIERPALSNSASTAVAYRIFSATSQDPGAWTTGFGSTPWAAMTVAAYQS